MVSFSHTFHADSDELVLDNADAVFDDEPAAPQPATPLVFGDEPEVAAEPAPEVPQRRRWLSPGTPTETAAPAAAAESSEPAAPAPRVKLGGTLFERMSSVTRGAAKEEEPGDKDPLDIPRFLHRQNNQ